MNESSSSVVQNLPQLQTQNTNLQQRKAVLQRKVSVVGTAENLKNGYYVLIVSKISQLRLNFIYSTKHD